MYQTFNEVIAHGEGQERRPKIFHCSRTRGRRPRRTRRSAADGSGARAVERHADGGHAAPQPRGRATRNRSAPRRPVGGADLEDHPGRSRCGRRHRRRRRSRYRSRWRRGFGRCRRSYDLACPGHPSGADLRRYLGRCWWGAAQFNGKPVDGSLESRRWVAFVTAAAASQTRPRWTGLKDPNLHLRLHRRAMDSRQRRSLRRVQRRDESTMARTHFNHKPDGSLTGEYLAIFDNGCASRYPVTLTRTRNQPTPRSSPPRVHPPRKSFHGRYHAVE